MTTPALPPRIPTRLLTWVLPSGTVGRSIRGDLVQEYHDRRKTHRMAGLWYWIEACKLAMRYGFRRVPPVTASGRAGTRGKRWRSLVQTFWMDAAHGVRLMQRKPFIAGMAIATLGLGVGVNAAVFAVVDGVLIRALPFADPDRIVRVFAHDDETSDGFAPATAFEYEQYRERARLFDDIAAYSIAPRDLTDGTTDPQALTIGRASWNLFDMLGVIPALGRGFREDDTRTGQRVTLLSYRFWRSTYGSDPTVLGRTVGIGHDPYTIVGVLPAHVDYPPNLALWRPFTADEYQDDDRELTIVGRLRADATLRDADSDLGTIAAALHEMDPEQAVAAVHVVRLHDAVVRDVRTPILTIWAAVACVLLIACTNLASLQLAQTTARQHELALRSALGAGRGRLMRQVITETAVLALPAAAIGIGTGYVALEMLTGLVPGDTPRLAEVALDPRVIVVMSLVTLASAIAVAILPAIRATRGGVRSHGVGTPHGEHRPLLQYALVSGQLAISTVLAVGAALLLASFARQMDFDRGFESSSLLAVTVDPPGDFESAVAGLEFLEQVVERVRRLPTVDAATMASTSPMNPLGFRSTITAGGTAATSRTPIDVFVKVIFGDFFEVGRTPLLAGRTFTPSDRRGTETVVVVNRALARALGFADNEAIGREIETIGTSGRIIGVAENIQPDAAEAVAPTLYVSYRQVLVPGGVLLVRTSASATSVAPAIRAILREMDPTMALNRFTTVEDEIRNVVAQPRFNALIVGIFAAVSVLLAAVGTYGVTAYVVRRREREMGVRQALGATGRDLTLTVFSTGLRMVAIGAAAGLLISYWMMRLVRNLLFGMDASSAFMAGTAVAILAATTLIACYLPARRTARLSPVIALRREA